MEMLNMVCKKDFEMNPEYEGAPIEISYKAGRSYVFLKVGDRYLGFDETQTVKHEMSQDLIDEYFFKEVLGRFNVTDQVVVEVEKKFRRIKLVD